MQKLEKGINKSKRQVILFILEILSEYTDPEHYLTLKEIGNILENDYLIPTEKKTISSHIHDLQDLGFDINQGSKGGYALFTRNFDESEVHFLIDAIFSSKAIPAKVADELLKKLQHMVSETKRRSYKHIYKNNEINRTTNSNVFYNIDFIQEAIENKKNISFQYISYTSSGAVSKRFNGYNFQVSPYALINNFGNYYLLCHRRTNDNEMVVRVDRITNLQWDSHKYIPITELPKFKNGFNISNYINNHIYLFGGDVVNARLKLFNDPKQIHKAVGAIKDWFGEKAFFEKVGDEVFCNVKCNETALKYWALQYGELVEILSPESLRDSLAKSTAILAEKYLKNN